MKLEIFLEHVNQGLPVPGQAYLLKKRLMENFN